MYNFLIGQSVVTDIVRDEIGNIFSIEYYSKVLKNLELIKLETFHPNGYIAMLELFSNGVKNGLHKEFFNIGNIKIDGRYTNGDKSGFWTEDFREGSTMRIFYDNGNKKSEGAVFFGIKKEERCWDIYGNTRNCIKGG